MAGILAYSSELNVLTLIKKCSVIAVTSFNKNQLSLYPRINEFNLCRPKKLYKAGIHSNKSKRSSSSPRLTNKVNQIYNNFKLSITADYNLTFFSSVFAKRYGA